MSDLAIGERGATLGWMSALAAVVVVVDLLVKRAVTWAFGPGSSQHAWWLIGDDVGFEYVRNTGAAFGLLRGNAELLGALSILIAIGFAVLILIELPSGVWAILAGGLVVGGAVGNLFERTMDGFVTDFVAIGPWPRFNVADSAITVGVAIFIGRLVFQSEPEHSPNGQEIGGTSTTEDGRRDRST